MFIDVFLSHPNYLIPTFAFCSEKLRFIRVKEWAKIQKGILNAGIFPGEHKYPDMEHMLLLIYSYKTMDSIVWCCF